MTDRSRNCTAQRRWFVALAALLALVLIHALVSAGLQRSLQAEIARIRASGEPASLAELGLPKIPERDNAAPIYARAWTIVDSTSAAASMNVLISAEDQPDSSKPWAKIRQAVGSLSSVTPLIEEARRRHRCRFPIDWEAGWDIPFDHVSKLSRLACLLSAKTALAAMDGDKSAALRCMRDEFRLSESLREEPAIISQMTRYQLIDRSCQSLRRCIQAGVIDERQARQHILALGGLDLNSSLTKTYQGYRIQMGLAGFRYFREHPRDFCNMRPGGASPWGGGVWAVMEGKPPMGPFLKSDQLIFFRTMRIIIADCKLPYRDFRAKHDALLSQTGYPWYAGVSTMSIGALDRPIVARDRAAANIALAQIALTLANYHKHHGYYPDDLVRLEVWCKQKLPTDPFSGRQMNYARQGNGFLLYSVGQDLTSQAGQVVATTDEWWKPGDIVWRADR